MSLKQRHSSAKNFQIPKMINKITAKQILKLLEINLENYNFNDFLIKGLSTDSREVSPDYIFVAIQGSLDDGHNFIAQAVQKGARLIIYENGKKEKVLHHLGNKKVLFAGVDYPRQILGKLACEFFNYPGKKLKVIGITGTNGKTTTTFLIESLLKEDNLRPGVIGTIHYKIGDHLLSAKNTTPDAIKLQHLFWHMVEHGLTHAVMEVSSHALAQGRVDGIEFNTAVFTNLTQDHLDYHKDLDDYFSAKTKLFIGLKKQHNAVINIDSGYGERLKEMTQAKIFDYGIKNQKAMIKAEEIKLKLDHTLFKVNTPKGKLDIKTNLIGRHNIYNILACIGVGLAEGLNFDAIAKAIEKVESVPGRLERIDAKGGFKVFVDYAHTDDALKNVLSTLRELRPNKIITVFGCGGDRDKKKRPLMGKVTSQLSDFLVLTNDNPRSEEPERIIEDIKTGFALNFNNYAVILDRQKAIAQAVSLAKENDFVLIAGKGHETYQIFKDKTIDFDDRRIVQEVLEGLKNV